MASAIEKAKKALQRKGPKKKYLVYFEETSSYTIEVEANSEEVAKEIAWEEQSNGNYGNGGDSTDITEVEELDSDDEDGDDEDN